MTSALDRPQAKVKLYISKRKKNHIPTELLPSVHAATSLWIQRTMEGKLKRFCERAEDLLRGNTDKISPEKEVKLQMQK